MQMQILAGMTAGPAVQTTIDRGNVPLVDLSAVAERNVGATRGTGDLKITPGGAPVQAAHDKGLGGLAKTRADGANHAGAETGVAGPTGVAQLGPSTSNVTVPDADGVIAGLRGRFRTCYQRGLDSDSTMSGKVLITAKIGPNGEVSSAEIASSTGLSPAVGQCIAGVVKRATFHAPGGGGATLQVPVTFVQQGK
jgi:TonB family protein